MKICMVTESVGRLGGVESVVRNLSNGLAAKGHNVQVICLDPVGVVNSQFSTDIDVIPLQSPASDSYFNRLDDNVTVRGLKLFRTFRNQELLSKLLDVIKPFNPEVVHTHKVRGFPFSVWRSVRAANNARIVHTCHDLELLSPIGTLRPDSSSSISSLLLRYWSALYRRPTQFVDWVTCPSHFLLETVQASKIFQRSEGFKVIPNFPELGGWDEALRSGVVAPRSNESLKVLFLGRLGSEKGVIQICRAVESLANSGKKVELRVAGRGPLESEIERFANENSSIEYVGLVEGAQKWTTYQWAHLVVVPSQVDESFGLSAAEAVFVGRPVIYTRRGGLSEVVTDEYTGMNCGTGTVEELIAVIERVIAQPSKLEFMSKNCRATAAKTTYLNWVSQYEEIYRAGGGR